MAIGPVTIGRLIASAPPHRLDLAAAAWSALSAESEPAMSELLLVKSVMPWPEPPPPYGVRLAPHLSLKARIHSSMAFPWAVEPEVRSSPSAHSKVTGLSPVAEAAEDPSPEAADVAALVPADVDVDEAELSSDPQADRVSTAASAAAPTSRRFVRAIFTRFPPLKGCRFHAWAHIRCALCRTLGADSGRPAPIR